jgi:hypothetical protein
VREKNARINLSQAASGMILQNHRRLPVSISVSKSPLHGLWNGLLKVFSKLASNFKGASKNIEFYSFSKKKQKM